MWKHEDFKYFVFFDLAEHFRKRSLWWERQMLNVTKCILNSCQVHLDRHCWNVGQFIIWPDLSPLLWILCQCNKQTQPLNEICELHNSIINIKKTVYFVIIFSFFKINNIIYCYMAAVTKYNLTMIFCDLFPQQCFCWLKQLVCKGEWEVLRTEGIVSCQTYPAPRSHYCQFDVSLAINGCV